MVFMDPSVFDTFRSYLNHLFMSINYMNILINNIIVDITWWKRAVFL